MAMKLTTENVRIIERKILDDLEMWGAEGKEAERLVQYICGVNDMANAVIRAIHELGGAERK